MESENIEEFLAELVEAIDVGAVTVLSQSVTELPNGQKIAAAHMTIAAREYVISIVPTKLNG